MRTATGDAQTIVLFGGTSEIGLAIVAGLITPATRHIVLACRDTTTGDTAATTLDAPDDCDIHVVAWDSTAIETHPGVVDQIVTDIGDLDIVIIAAGVLGSQDDHDTNPVAAGDVIVANTAGPITTGTVVAGIMRRQHHGHLVVLSSVAGIRVRAANHTYGASKAGLDAWAHGLADHLHDTGVHVTIVRPGFVRGRMTAGRPTAPFATTPTAVATDTVTAIRAQRRVVHSPRILRWVFLALRHLPAALWRRIPG
jgi:decaprenylphospho-beta-D-erythro-pentofuranosid-2-ulose 2-reductase